MTADTMSSKVWSFCTTLPSRIQAEREKMTPTKKAAKRARKKARKTS